MERQKFVKEYSKWLEQGTAAVFVGAGLSQRAGYPNWRALLTDIADELNIRLDQEHDLAGVAQWYINKNGKRRTQIAQVIKNSFPDKDEVPIPHRILARLPVRCIWTTNYDRLIEKAWELQRRKIDVKSITSHLSVSDPWADTTLYKMHGSVDSPADVVIATDDYELYRRSRAGFLQMLNGHLIGMHLLFIGISFSDPNLGHLLGMIREAMDDNVTSHYAIVRRPKGGKSAGATQRYAYEKSRHAHWVDDLQRYGISCIEIDEFEDIDAILLDVEAATSRRSVFVSGSFPEGIRGSQRDLVEDIATSTGRMIGEKKLRLVSGFGLIVGSAAVAGVLEKLYADAVPALDRSLFLRPFPRQPPTGWTKAAFQTRYREDLIKQAGVCIFIGGFKRSSPTSERLAPADGVLEEFEIARSNNKIILPLAASGGSAAEIWSRLEKAGGGKAANLPQATFKKLGKLDASVDEVSKTLHDALEAIINI